ncbi:MAG: tRNA (adenosine(37)-N6)-threonylcarbamoyltransferase complex ATPase subunit type 1 TsaE [Candidatus Omnitrophica bacterium]|nr:tRNA (adenosine(37)-N6)-threonylcarbamoyltransferase complex ATPase subunit type 1 TsaE [Candidatus Omnitrophota bacterium]MDD5042496.1 tRNA (adenosine(37)-N6)-threonylcarbamoyltransferase complex ATPase subunit type 1 TsaE [Candidatus Omnitrophota bacterium]MDD5501009.1 tRNA (adenosine(37)-N6)-threonylcarbamoyltransferase complex ATPase subunit type 1 TsaE [Candidatus Omnitrophota bacterium]
MRILSLSASHTSAIGRSLARRMRGGEIILLSGPLGAGKTVVAKGIASGLGIDSNGVISPTFVLLRVYEGRIGLNHFDFYRIVGPEEIFALGYEEYFYSEAATLIEWPERLKFLLPKEYLKIKLVVGDKNKRRIIFEAKGKRYKELLKGFYEDIRD